MSGTGELTDMTERQILYRLVGDVEALKKDSENGSKSREITRAKVDSIETAVHDINRKLDRLVDREEDRDGRLTDCEQGVADYRKTKTRVVSMVGGVGLGAGGVGGAFGAWLAKWFGGS